VVGGGIAGACAVWDASLRGLRAGLIERSDFASGTSAHSLRVLHGGIRYLQHLDIARLRESCAERGAFLRIAPHLTRPMPFALPTYGMGLRGKLPLRAAFAMLNVLTAGRNRDTRLRSQQIPAPYCMSRREFVAKFPAFDAPDLTGAGVFYDGQICNPPRVVYSIVRAAQDNGALAANYCSAERLLVHDGKAVGVEARDHISGAAFEIRARIVVNLTGPFAPTVNASAFGGEKLNIPLSRDMAFVINRNLLPDIALGIQTRYRDPDAWLSRGNRHIFIVPWRGYTLIGVNSKVYEGDPFKLTVSPEEIQGFVEEIREACPAWDITREDVAVVNAGLLPIGEGEQGQKGLSLGKRSPLIDHATRGGPDGLITGMSVRWTMGRQVAQGVIDLVAHKLGAKPTPCTTASTQVHGGDITDKDQLLASLRKEASSVVPQTALVHLADTFGSEASTVLKAG
jgi:glycerol-3-phosphate dehydrogenase